MMLSKAEYEQWCSNRQSMPHRLAINTENYVKYEWQDGTIYEIKISQWSPMIKESQVYINGILVYEYTTA